MSFFRSLINLVKFNNLPLKEKKFVFFSETNFYKDHYIDLLENLEKYQKGSVVIVTSDINDFNFYKFKFKTFLIENYLILSVFFKILECFFLITTLSDLGNNFEKSKKCKKFVYFFHAILSVHKIYTHTAFKHYDIVFTNGNYQTKELNFIEEKFKFPKKKIIETGYFYLDKLKKVINKTRLIDKKILYAPSWNKNKKNLMSDYSIKIIGLLLENNFKVIFRPHPEHYKRQKKQLNKIKSKFLSNKDFELDESKSNINSLEEAAILITDNSGITFEFVLALKRPVIYLDYIDKIHNLNFDQINLDTIEDNFKQTFGNVLNINELNKLPKICSRLCKTKNFTDQDVKNFEMKFMSNINNSSKVAASFLIEEIKRYGYSSK